MRLSYTYSEVDEESGKIINDNVRGNRMITDASVVTEADDILAYAQSSVEA